MSYGRRYDFGMENRFVDAKEKALRTENDGDRSVASRERLRHLFGAQQSI